jgi:putative ABC transport system permease protein
MGVPSQTKSNGGYAVEGGRTFEQMGIRSPQAYFTVVTPESFKTLGVPLVLGRDFSDRDEENAPFTAIVNEALVRATFSDADPIGRRIATGLDGAKGPDGTYFMTIIGVVKDVRWDNPARPGQPQIFMPYLQHPFYAAGLSITVRTSGDPRLVGHTVTEKIRALNDQVPVRISTMDDELGTAVSAPRFRTILLATFAGLALVLAMAGVYGVVSFMTSQRQNELGLRMALGAQRLEVVRLTVLSGLRLTAAGVAIGWIVSLGATRVLSTMLFAVPERDPFVFFLAPTILIVVACLASMAPALRASRVDPAVVLRAE